MRNKREQGVFVPLAALVLGGVVTLLFAAGVDALLVRISRSALQNITNTLCNSLVYEAINPDSVALGFRDGVETFKHDLLYGDVTNAMLIMSLPKETKLDQLDVNYVCEDDRPITLNEVADTPSGGKPAGNFATFGLPNCSLLGGKDCTLWAYPNVELPPGLPASMNNIFFPGRAVGCRLTAKVDRYSFGADSTIEAQSVYAAFQRKDDGELVLNQRPRALRIAIGTQLTTPPLDYDSTPLRLERGRFTMGAVVRAYKAAGGNSSNLFPFLERYDLFCPPVAGSDSNWCPDYKDPSKTLSAALLSLSHTHAFLAPRPVSLLNYINPTAFDPENGIPPQFLREGFDLSGQLFDGVTALEEKEDRRREMILSCLNVPTLIRNIISQTLVGMATRDGVLRRMTEIVHLNPLNWTLDTSDSITRMGMPVNYATVMVPMGTDLAAREFQLPFVTFRQDPLLGHGTTPYEGIGPLLLDGLPKDTKSIVPSTFPTPLPSGLESAAVVHPFYYANNPALNNVQQKIHAEIATQLRRCLHLYTGLTDGAASQEEHRGVAIFHNPRLVDSKHGLLTSPSGLMHYDSALYPGSDNTSQGRYRGDIRPADQGAGYFPIEANASPQLAQPQEHEYPWSDGVLQAPLNTRRLNAFELVSVLGSSQRCPYSNLGEGSEIVCKAKNAPTTPVAQLTKSILYGEVSQPAEDVELVSDYLGFLLPLHGDGIDPPYQEPSTLLKASSSTSWPTDYSSGDRYSLETQRPCEDSALVIISHSLPHEADYGNFDMLQATLEKFRVNSEHAPYLFIILPPPRMQNIDERADKYVIDGDNPNSSLLVLAPEACARGGCIGDHAEQEYHRYWGELLDPTSSNYIVPTIRRFFFERLYEVRRVL